jgi:subtilase family serine protease
VNKIFSAVMAAMLAVSARAESGRQQLHGIRPAEAANLQPVGRLDGATRLKLAVGLPSRDQAGLDAFLRQLYDPASSNYHRYLTPSQFTERFGPSEADYQAVTAFMKARGLNVTRQHANRVVLDVEGASADVERAFHVTMRLYPHPTEARNFFAPDMEPSMDLAVPVLHIAGLDNFTRPHPKLRKRAAPGPTSRAGTAPGGELWGNDFRNAYVPGSSLTGAGQNMGLLELESFYPSDISAYEDAIGMSAANRPQLVVVTVSTQATPTDAGEDGEECSLDIEMAVSMAPGLSKVYVFEDGNTAYSNVPFDDILESMVTYTNVLQFSCSWGGTLAADPTAEMLWKQMDAQGQSFFDASGDAGAFVGNIQFPSDSPSITQVGGTTLSIGDAPAYSWAGEVSWDWDSGPTVTSRHAASSSGGISTYYAIPPWQTNLNMTASQGSSAWRNTPDVAANADNCYIYSEDGQQAGGWGGTSCAAPLWAGLAALANQQAAANGLKPIGFINSALYALASGPDSAIYFHDITSGNNTWRSSPGRFSAVPGYDLCCGLGSPIGNNLIDALAPQIPLAIPALAATARDGQILFTFSTVQGFVYQIQSSTSLSGAPWLAAGSAINGTGAPVTVAITAPSSGQQFYRLSITP